MADMALLAGSGARSKFVPGAMATRNGNQGALGGRREWGDPMFDGLYDM